MSPCKLHQGAGRDIVRDQPAIAVQCTHQTRDSKHIISIISAKETFCDLLQSTPRNSDPTRSFYAIYDHWTRSVDILQFSASADIMWEIDPDTRTKVSGILLPLILARLSYYEYPMINEIEQSRC